MTIRKLLTGILVLALGLSFTGCSAETSTSTDASSSNLIYENTISPNEKYIEQESDKVFYTIQIGLGAPVNTVYPRGVRLFV